jgi:2-keto-4-pentenoate hydratase
MQELMGIDQPCCGMIFAKRIFTSPARLAFADFISLKLECEIALRLGRDLEAGTGHSGASVAVAVSQAMPAFELVEDRNAEYRKVDVKSLVADNCWNAGVVLGTGAPYAAGRSLTGLEGVLDIDGARATQGLTEDPLEVLAWTANLLGERGRGLKAGQIVMTGSVIATLPAVAGKTFRFAVEGLGETVLAVE